MGKLNALRVIRRNDTIFIPLPPELWDKTGFGSCECGKCKGDSQWDTLAVSAIPQERDYTWTVHAPEYRSNEHKAPDKQPRFNIGDQYVTKRKNSSHTHTIRDILRTYNNRGELVQVTYTATHEFAGQTITDHNVLETTIARGLIK